MKTNIGIICRRNRDDKSEALWDIIRVLCHEWYRKSQILQRIPVVRIIRREKFAFTTQSINL